MSSGDNVALLILLLLPSFEFTMDGSSASETRVSVIEGLRGGKEGRSEKCEEQDWNKERRGGAVVKFFALQPERRGFEPQPKPSCRDLGQVLHSLLPCSTLMSVCVHF